MFRVCALVVAMLVSRPAVAEDTDPRQEVSTRRRVVAVLAAIGPGFLLRGTGSFLVRERRTARRLAATAAIGLGGMAVGGLPVGLSRGNPYTIVPGVPLLVAGAGLFFTTWWADIAIAAGIESPGTARAAPPWSLELGTVWLHDGYRERGLVRTAGRLELGRIGVGASALLDSEGDSREGEVELRVRIRGAAATGAPIRSGNRLAARIAIRHRRDDADRVTVATGEAELIGRLDFGDIDPVLGGTFAELSTGLGLERASYADDHDYGSLLLSTFTWGAYLGDRGEATVFYDNRRDSLAGGLAAWRAAGFVGSFGAAVDVLVAPRWAVRGQVEVGSAWVTTAVLRYQGGRR